MLSLFDLADLLLALSPWPKGKPVTVVIGVAVLCLAIIIALFLLYLRLTS